MNLNEMKNSIQKEAFQKGIDKLLGREIREL